MDEAPKLGSISREDAEREMVLNMRIKDFVRELKESEPKSITAVDVHDKIIGLTGGFDKRPV